MKLDFFSKVILVFISANLTIISAHILIPNASAQRVDTASNMFMMRMCERASGTIYCADVTPDFHLKVHVKDLERLPAEISSQIAGRIGGPISNQINQQMNRISGQVSELQVKIDQIAQRR